MHSVASRRPIDGVHIGSNPERPKPHCELETRFKPIHSTPTKTPSRASLRDPQGHGRPRFSFFHPDCQRARKPSTAPKRRRRSSPDQAGLPATTRSRGTPHRGFLKSRRALGPRPGLQGEHSRSGPKPKPQKRRRPSARAAGVSPPPMTALCQHAAGRSSDDFQKNRAPSSACCFRLRLSTGQPQRFPRKRAL